MRNVTYLWNLLWKAVLQRSQVSFIGYVKLICEDLHHVSWNTCPPLLHGWDYGRSHEGEFTRRGSRDRTKSIGRERTRNSGWFGNDSLVVEEGPKDGTNLSSEAGETDGFLDGERDWLDSALEEECLNPPKSFASVNAAMGDALHSSNVLFLIYSYI